MIRLTPRCVTVIRAPLHYTPAIAAETFAALWPDTDSGRDNMERRLWQLCDEGLLARHVAVAKLAREVSLFYHWLPGMPDPDFGPRAWELAKRWDALEPRRVVFYTAGERAARHFGCSIRNPLKSASALSHNLGWGQVVLHYIVHHPLLARALVAEDVIAESRGYGEKVVDACIVDSTSTPALALEFAGQSYAASNGQRLREIHRDCAARGAGLPYEVWTVAPGEKR